MQEIISVAFFAGRRSFVHRNRLHSPLCALFDEQNPARPAKKIASTQFIEPAYIEGGVANDRVIDTVNLYMAGLMDAATALERLAWHQPSNQICLLSQTITDQYLVYDGTEPAK